MFGRHNLPVILTPDSGFTELTVNNVDAHVARIHRGMEQDMEQMVFGSDVQ